MTSNSAAAIISRPWDVFLFTKKNNLSVFLSFFKFRRKLTVIKSLCCHQEAVVLTESLPLAETVELYFSTQRCLLLMKPPVCVLVTALLSIRRLFTCLTSLCDSITVVELTYWQAGLRDLAVQRLWQQEWWSHHPDKHKITVYHH